jgi:hypothetical protein
MMALITRNVVFAMERHGFDPIVRIRAVRIAHKTSRQTHLAGRPF